MTHTQHEPPAVEPPPRGTQVMAVVRWLLVAVMAVIAVLSVVYSFGLVDPGGASAEAAQYYCPMHPQVVQEHPGECPICSMSLVLKKGSQAAPTATHDHAPAAPHQGHRHEATDGFHCPMHPEETGADASARCPLCMMKLEARPPLAAPPPAPEAPTPRRSVRDKRPRAQHMQDAKPATEPVPTPATVASAAGVPGLVPVQLSLDRIQLIGVRTARASREPLVSELQASALVAADESRFARVHTRFSGWIERLGATTTTGEKVRRGQLLASIYSPELLPAQQEFLAARKWSASAGAQPQAAMPDQLLPGSMADDARKRLELLGMSSAEIDRVAQSGAPTRTVSVSAPIAGHIVRRDAIEGTYVQPGSALFEIADLSKLWVLAEIYEHEIGRVSVGQLARVEAAAYPGQAFQGKVAFIYPSVNTDTRTLRVRIVLDNKELKLRPGMYGTVTIVLAKADGIVIPSEALVDTGDHQYVFVAKNAGRFEPRRVRVGERAHGKVQILEGLADGDLVVTTANFMIDSESRLRAAIEGGP